MKDIPSNFASFSILQVTPQYCENSECKEFGYVTMVGILDQNMEDNSDK